jgi:hypothetical protein
MESGMEKTVTHQKFVFPKRMMKTHKQHNKNCNKENLQTRPSRPVTKYGIYPNIKKNQN